MPSSRQSHSGSQRGVPLATSLGRAAQSFLPLRNPFRRNDPHSLRSTKPSSPHSPPNKTSSARLGRLVTHVVNFCTQLDPDGLAIRRASSIIHPSTFSPFLQLDHCGPDPVGSHAVVGGEAPLCGQQALTYVVRGQVHLHDSCGNQTVLRPGSVSLLTAGSGLVASHTLRGPTIEYFSIWINIPKEMRSAPPKQQTTETPPCAIVGHGEAGARIRVLAGPHRPHALHKMGDKREGRKLVELETVAGNAAVYDIHMQRKSQLVLNPETQSVFIYVYRGVALIANKTKVEEGDFAVLESNRGLPVVIDSYGAHMETEDEPQHDWTDFDVFVENSCWCMVLAGDPVMEPVSMLSGIVACTPQEIRKAFQEFTCGSMGANSPPKLNGLAARIMKGSDDESTDMGHTGSEENSDDAAYFADFRFEELEDEEIGQAEEQF